MIDNCDESPIAPKGRRTREERNLGHFILTATLLGLVLPLYISPGIDVCFSNLRWLSSLKRVQDLIRLNMVTATEACSLDWLILVYYFMWISGMIFFMYLARDALRRRVAATSVTPRKLLTWGLLFTLFFVGFNGIIISTLSKPALPIYAQINYMHELKGFLLAKILIFLSIGLVAVAINLFGNFLILTRSAHETD